MDKDSRNYYGGRKYEDYSSGNASNSNASTFPNGERKYFDDSLLKRHIDPQTAERKQQEIIASQQRAVRNTQNNNFAVNDFKKSASEAKPRQSYDSYDVASTDIYDKYTNYNTYTPSASNDYYSSNQMMSYDSNLGYPSDERPLSRSYRSADVDGFNRAERGASDMRRDRRDRRVPDDNRKRKGKNKSRNPYDDDGIDISSGTPKKTNKKKKIISIVAITLAVLIALGSGVAFGVTKWYNKNFKSETDFNVTPVEQKVSGIKNIALFGVDSRSGDFTGHSDVIMVLSLNFDTGDVKLISILRDSYVEMEGHKDQKITHAYGYGGPSLAVDTINKNFDLDIQDYVTVNFESLADIIDAIGGVEVEVSSTEKKNINYHGPNTYKDFKKVTETGKIKLDGEQAVTYARLRYDSDNNRALRQREVLEAIYSNVMGMSASKYPALITSLMPYVETSLDLQEILSMTKILSKGIKVHQTSVPDEKYEEDLKSGIYEGAWVWRYDTHKAGERIHSFIYDNDYSSEIKPKTSTTASSDN